MDEMLRWEGRGNAEYTLAVCYIAVSRGQKDDGNGKSWFSVRGLGRVQSQDHRKDGWEHGSGVVLLKGICTSK